MSNSTATLIQEQINYVIDQLVELKNHFQTGYTMDQYFGELIYAPMTVDQFNAKFEPLNDQLTQLRYQQAEF
jgi:hypothetical protein